MAALPSEADIELILVERAANDPKRPLAIDPWNQVNRLYKIAKHSV